MKRSNLFRLSIAAILLMAGLSPVEAQRCGRTRVVRCRPTRQVTRVCRPRRQPTRRVRCCPTCPPPQCGSIMYYSTPNGMVLAPQVANDPMITQGQPDALQIQRYESRAPQAMKSMQLQTIPKPEPLSGQVQVPCTEGPVTGCSACPAKKLLSLGNNWCMFRVDCCNKNTSSTYSFNCSTEVKSCVNNQCTGIAGTDIITNFTAQPSTTNATAAGGCTLATPTFASINVGGTTHYYKLYDVTDPDVTCTWRWGFQVSDQPANPVAATALAQKAHNLPGPIPIGTNVWTLTLSNGKQYEVLSAHGIGP